MLNYHNEIAQATLNEFPEFSEVLLRSSKFHITQQSLDFAKEYIFTETNDKTNQLKLLMKLPYPEIFLTCMLGNANRLYGIHAFEITLERFNDLKKQFPLQSDLLLVPRKTVSKQHHEALVLTFLTQLDGRLCKFQMISRVEDDPSSPNLLTETKIIEDSYIKTNVQTHIRREQYSLLISFVCATLALINSPNIIHLQQGFNANDYTKLNKKRQKNGKLPYLEYKTLTIKKEIIESIKEQQNREGTARRMHMRRGHFKQRKNGLYWWSPHFAGCKELGFIQKDYEVK